MNRARANITRSFSGVLAAMALAAGVCTAQPPATSEQPGDRPAGPQPTSTRGRGERELLRQLMTLPPEERRVKLRAYLAEREERARKINEALSKAIKALDDGASLDDIGALIPSESRELRGGGGPGSNFGTGMDGAPPPPPGSSTAAPTNPDELGPVPMPGLSGPGSGQGRGGRPDENPPKPFEGPITDDDRAVVNEFLVAAAPPQMREMIKQLEKNNPERAEMKLRETLPRIRWLIDLRKVDRAAYDLRLEDIRHGREAFEAARDLAKFDRTNAGKGSTDDRSGISERLRSALSEQYRVRGELMSREVAKMETDLGKRQAELAKHAEGREATITRMMEKLTERAADWMKRRERGSAGGEDHGKRGRDGAPQPGEKPVPRP